MVDSLVLPARNHEPLVLVIPDDVGITALLNESGLRTCSAIDGLEALTRFAELGPDLVLTSMRLPDLSGLELCSRLRRRSDIPIVMLTDPDSITEPEVGLSLGADGYVAWPHRPWELVARLRAILRRTHGIPSKVPTAPYEVGGVRLNPRGFYVKIGGRQVQLSPTEFTLLQMLITRPGRAVPKEALANRLWGPDYDFASRRLEVNVSRLRSKLAAGHGQAGAIETVRGIGYVYQVSPLAQQRLTQS